VKAENWVRLPEFPSSVKAAQDDPFAGLRNRLGLKYFSFVFQWIAPYVEHVGKAARNSGTSNDPGRLDTDELFVSGEIEAASHAVKMRP
jgi:hypothetical protein